MDYDTEWSEGAELPYRHLLSDSDGIFVPLPPERTDLRREPSVGSVLALRAECLDLLQILGVPEKLRLDRGILDSKVAEGGSPKPLWQRFRLEVSGALCLLEAAERSVSLGCGLSLDWLYGEMPSGVLLTHLSAFYFGFNTFQDCKIDERGRAVLVSFENGWKYRVPTALLVWGERIVWEAQPVAFSAAIDPLSNDTFDLALTSGEVFSVSCHDLLSLCEPRYDGFEEWDSPHAKVVKEWFEREGPFRLGRESARVLSGNELES